ncbi:MAG: hypothetical protein RR740_00400 [Pseudomonas sp.]
MRLQVQRKRLVLQSDADEGKLEICWSNRGEPYREGIELNLDNRVNGEQASVFIEGWETRVLRDLLNRLYPISTDEHVDAVALNAIADALAADASNPEAEQQSQLVRDLSKLVAQREAFAQQAEELEKWKARALEAEADLKELPTQDMVLLQADNYAKAGDDETRQQARADLHTMIIHLNTDN